MLRADLRRDRSRSLLGTLDELAPDGLVEALTAERAGVRALVADEWPAGVGPELTNHVELRYPGQLWSVRVPVEASDDEAIRRAALDAGRIRADFEAAYEALYGHIQPDGRLEVTGLGVVATGRLVDDAGRSAQSPRDPIDRRRAGHRRCWLGPTDGWADVAVHRGADLRPGHRLDGPYLIDAETTTVLGLPGDRLTVDARGDLQVELP